MPRTDPASARRDDVSASWPGRGDPVAISSVRAVDGGVEATVRVAGPHDMRTTGRPGLSDRTLGLLPGIRRHECESGSPRGIVAELADTETPHLLEHVALELLARAGWPRSIRGRTRWDFAADGPGVFRVTLYGVEPRPGERALRVAAIVVAYVLRGGDAPDIEGLVGSLE